MYIRLYIFLSECIYIYTEKDGRMCSNSGCSQDAGLRCATCKLVFYCSRQCQKKDWKLGHRAVCRFLPLADAHMQDVDLRLFHEIEALVIASDWRSIMALEDNIGVQAPVAVAARLRLCYGQQHREKALQFAGFFCMACQGRAFFRRGLAWGLLAVQDCRGFDSMGALMLEGVGLTLLGGCYVALGLFGLANKSTSRAMVIFLQADAQLELLRAATQMGLLFVAQGRYLKGQEVLFSALEIASRELDSASSDPDVMAAFANLYGALSQCHTGLHHYDDALSALAQCECLFVARHAAHAFPNEHELTWCWLRHGVLLWAKTRETKDGELPPHQLQQLELARDKIQQAMLRAEELNHVNDVQQCTLMLSFVMFDLEGCAVDGSGMALLSTYLRMTSTKCLGRDHATVISYRRRDFCHGCFDTRELNVQLLICGHCKIARFCDEVCQKRASKTGNFHEGVKHRDICPLLRVWHRVSKVVAV